MFNLKVNTYLKINDMSKFESMLKSVFCAYLLTQLIYYDHIKCTRVNKVTYPTRRYVLIFLFLVGSKKSFYLQANTWIRIYLHTDPPHVNTHTHIHTHTHIYIYICVYVAVFVCVWRGGYFAK